jgi:hypothetical protein
MQSIYEKEIKSGEYELVKIDTEESEMIGDYKTRVIEEEKELTLKIDSLYSFVESERFKELDVSEQGLLIEQRGFMIEYQEVLQKRISKF